MFDSTLYDLKSNAYLDCYNLLQDTTLENIQNFIELQNIQRDNTIEWLNEPEQSSIQNIIFACHHPIVEIKVFLPTHPKYSQFFCT